MKQPKAVIFDWDNTLVDTWPHLQYASNVTLSAFKLNTWTLEETKANVHHSAREVFPKIFGDRAKEATEIYYKAYFSSLEKTGIIPIPGANDIINFLHNKGITLSIVSNKVNTNLRNEVKKLGWENYFTSIVGSLDAAKDKPHPEPVYFALKNCEISPSLHNVWFVGDSIVDIECAKNSNCLPILFGDKKAAEGVDNLGIDYKHVNDHTEFMEILKIIK